MKKTTTKKTTAAAKPAAAPKPSAPAKKAAPKKAAAPAPAPVAKKAAPAKKAPAVKAAPAAKSAPAAKGTTLVASIDVGFGNILYIRGEGPGLSWEKGVKLACVADDRWSITLAPSEKPVVFKFLLNDVAWCDGNDYIAASGSELEIKPTFVAG